MGILNLSESVIEYLLISSTLLFLMGMISLFVVRLLGIKGKTKIWIFVLVFILPVIYPVRSLLPESVRIPIQMQSDYLKPLTIIASGNPVSAETSILSVSPEAKGKFTNRKIIVAEEEVSPLSVKEMAIYTASMFYKNWKQVATLLWVLIFSIFFIRLVASTRAIKKLLTLSTPVADQKILELLRQCASDTGLTYVPLLYEAQGISTPMAMGFFKPVIVIPTHLVTEKYIHGLRFTLLHELKHIDQRHNLWLFIESLIGAIYFFHPVIHWIKRKIHEEMEKICDGHVIKVTHKNVTYADFLLNEIWQNSSGRYPAFSLPFITSTSKTAARVRSIIENRAVSASKPAREIVVAVTVFIVFSSFMFITGATRVQGPEKMAIPISSVEAINRVTVPVQTEDLERIKASSATTPVTSPKDNKAIETVTIQNNTQIANKGEYLTDKRIEKSGPAPVKQVNSTAENRDMKKSLQTPEQISEQPESVMINKSDSSNNIPQTTVNPIKETMVETLPPPAETTAQKYLGTPVKELTTYRIDNIKALDQYTILFIMRGGDMYLTRLSGPCPALLYANSLMQLSITAGRISALDHIQVISNGNIIGITGTFGDFYPYKYQGNKAEALKFLKKTLLKDLIAEGAFK